MFWTLAIEGKVDPKDLDEAKVKQEKAKLDRETTEVKIAISKVIYLSLMAHGSSTCILTIAFY